jgi:hypothetical protein
MKRPLALLLPVLVASCAPSADIETSSSPITNGALDDGDPAVVGLRIAGGPAYCTGTLINTRVVITAAHCVRPMITVFFGSVPPRGSDVDTIDARPHPLYVTSTLANDLGLLLLSRESTVTPAGLWTQPLDESIIGAPLRIVGFGNTGTTTSSVTRKRTGHSVIESLEPTKFAFRPTPSQTCEGDSGGPGFLSSGATELLAGVTSSGDPQCRIFAHDTRVDAFLDDFIQPYLKATAIGARSVGQTCFYDANCARGSCVAADEDPAVRYCASACAKSADCPAPMQCDPVGGALRCHYRPPSPGTLGTACAQSFECRSNLCGQLPGASKSSCLKPCMMDDECSSGGHCVPFSGDVRACQPAHTSCSCTTEHARRGNFAALAAFLAVLVAAGLLRATRTRNA